ncbi:retroviral-like aspartic protease family protein [Novosphingobium sp.]|uniref:retroviral-like aspartic protease family protein n=1 Tax=Novosphingobium sp. TaxID=1874826 RepID=UPI0025FF444E|nr:retroviral-like aspartic protease family protein [Novosphingobium sp.]
MKTLAKGPTGIALAGIMIIAATAAMAENPQKPRSRMPPLTPAVIDDTLVIDGKEIDARKLRSRLTVDVGVNGTGPYRFVVDSGADTSVIGRRLANALALREGRPVLLNAITETRTVNRVLVNALQVGPNQFRDMELPRLEERFIGANGMIGLDALVDQRLMLDFERRRIAVEDASRPAPKWDGEIVVTAKLKKGQLILTHVRSKDLSLDAVVDTGSEVTIGNSALRARIAKRKNARIIKAEITGVTGKVEEVDLVYVEELKIGTITLRNVPIAFADVPPFEVFELEKKPALLLGTDLMENFRRVSLDFRARKVRFQLRNCRPEGVYVSYEQPTILISERADSGVCKR